jgi:hypothetical protein
MVDNPTRRSVGGRRAFRGTDNAAYAGSGGGTGVDLATVGLAWIQYVRVWQPADATWSTEVDAFADVAAVPEPATWGLAAAILLACVSSSRLLWPLSRERRPSGTLVLAGQDLAVGEGHNERAVVRIPAV